MFDGGEVRRWKGEGEKNTETGRKRKSKDMAGAGGAAKEESCLQASFTIEAALLVPIVLAVLFALLQIILYLHDTVWAEAWLHQQAWNHRWSLENGITNTGDPGAGDEAAGPGPAPVLAVLRCTGSGLTQRFGKVRAEASFDVFLLPRYAAAVWGSDLTAMEKTVTERVINTPGFLRIAGAILEEMED